MELVEAYGFKTILENNKEKLPFVYERYLDYVSQFSEEEFSRSGGGRTYKKITVDDVKNIEEIWDILEPVYWTIDIYSSYKDYLKSAESFTLEQRYLNATTWYFIEVNNGGHFQFLDNSTGIVWEDALNGFRLFGMTEIADNFNKVIDLFGGVIPFEREERWKKMDKLNENFEELLEAADIFVYNYDGVFEDVYVKAHPEKFAFEGYYNKIV